MPRTVHGSALRDWRWEGNVQHAIVEFLRGVGWAVVAEADTARQQRGVDIEARRWARRLLVEVKGYPSTTYVGGTRAGQPKPTHPSLQAHHWFSHAFLAASEQRTADRFAEVAIGLPRMDRYEGLARGVRGALERLGIGLLFVEEGGDVSWLLEPSRADSRYTALVRGPENSDPSTAPSGTLAWQDGRTLVEGDASFLIAKDFAVVRPGDPQTSLVPEDGEEFVIATAWAVAGSYTWVTLRDDDGRELSREEMLGLGRSIWPGLESTQSEP